VAAAQVITPQGMLVVLLLALGRQNYSSVTIGRSLTIGSGRVWWIVWLANGTQEYET